MNTPRPPFHEDNRPITHYSAMQQIICEGILINLFHNFTYTYGMPRTHNSRLKWSAALLALIQYEYVTPNGRFLTQKGFEKVQTHGREFTNEQANK